MNQNKSNTFLIIIFIIICIFKRLFFAAAGKIHIRPQKLDSSQIIDVKKCEYALCQIRLKTQ